MSKYRIEFEFDYINNNEYSTEQDVIDCIVADVLVAIQKAIENITSNIEYGEFKIIRKD